MRSLDWAMKTFPVDPERVSITGVSMGGTGTAQLAFFYADRFSAVSPLCGYQSYFIRHDTSHRPLRPWEKDRMRHWSPTSWAENGRNMPMFLAQGTKDYPHENGKVLVKRYRALGYSVSEDWPDIGHHVWEIEWKGAKMWPWLARHRHDPSPRHITLKSDQLRYAKQDWLRITVLATPGRMGLVDAKDRRPAPRSDRPPTRSMHCRSTGRGRSSATTRPCSSRSTGARWNSRRTSRSPHTGPQRAGRPARSRRRRATSTPASKARSATPSSVPSPSSTARSIHPRPARIARCAEAFAAVRYGEDIHYPVLADRDVDREVERTHSLFLVGTRADNRLLRSLDAALPVHVRHGALLLGKHRYAGPDVGAIFVHANPRHPDRYVVAVEAVDAGGIWQALSLPRLLPDFIVYDAGLAAASGQQVLGSARVLAGGFFQRDWSLPAHVGDPDAGSSTNAR